MQQHLYLNKFGGSRQSRERLFWQFLLKKKILQESQLKEALSWHGKKNLPYEDIGKVCRLIVNLNFAKEAAMLSAINSYFSISIKNISEDIDEIIRINNKSGILANPLRLHHSISFKISCIFMLVISLTTLVIGVTTLNRQKTLLFKQTLQTGKITLQYYAGTAKVPLLEDNTLELNTIIKGASKVEGFVYAFIINNDRILKAHTDFNLVGSLLPQSLPKIQHDTEGIYTYFNFTSPENQNILNISTPVLFKSKILGQVHLGISIDFLDEKINKETRFIFLLALLVIFLGFISAIILGVRLSRPILNLVEATKEVANGNFDHRVNVERSDELGHLGNSFNFMAEELKAKSLMHEIFGKYVSADILEMIMVNPEKGWLKGKRNNASILFTDIRGFTAYSLCLEPEEVVMALNKYFEIASEVIMESGGYVDKFIGDAVLGVFGVPIPDIDHARMAVIASIKMQSKLSEAASGKYKILSKVGVAIDSGMVVSGNLGSDVKMEYSVIGDCVNIAAKLNDFAGEGEIIISESTYEASKGLIKVTPVDLVSGKDRVLPKKIFKVLRLEPVS